MFNSPKGTEVWLIVRLFVGWYLFSSLFNIYAKKSLNGANAVTPLFNTTVQCAFGIVISFFLLQGNVFSLVFRLTKKNWPLFLATSFLHFVGNWMTTKSIASASIAFAHIIKAAEPVFTVILTRLILNKKYSFHLYSSLVPIVGGVGLVIVGKFAGSKGMPQLDEKIVPAFIGAMVSNLCFASRNVLSKKLFDSLRSTEDDESDSLLGGKDVVFAMYSVWSSIFGIAFIFIELGHAAALGTAQTSISVMSLFAPIQVLMFCSIAGICHALYNAFSLKVLTHVAAVTHSVGNCMKRVVVLLASFIIFGMHMTGLMVVGAVVALFGVFLYTVEKSSPPQNEQLPGNDTQPSTTDKYRILLRSMPWVCTLFLVFSWTQA